MINQNIPHYKLIARNWSLEKPCGQLQVECLNSGMVENFPLSNTFPQLICTKSKSIRIIIILPELPSFKRNLSYRTFHQNQKIYLNMLNIVRGNYHHYSGLLSQSQNY